MEDRKGSYLIPIVMALCMSVGLYMGNVLTPQDASVATTGELRYQKIQDIIRILDQRYVDSVDAKALFEETIGNMLHTLDPHSNYIPAEDLMAMNEVIEGKFGGIGIRFFIIRDTFCVTNVLPGSPSEVAGLKAGDKIIKIDGQTVASKKLSSDDAMGMLKGIEGTDVKLTLLRDGKQVTKKVVRGSIPVSSVVASYMISKDIGYIRIEQFSVATADEFAAASEELKKKGLKKLIIDLRNNGGGVLTGATDIADEFLVANTPIVETRGEHTPAYTYRATSKSKLKDIELAILINSNSASASEILAGAIQDNDRGVIIGRRSFGKGLVQEDFPLKDGSSLRLTIARYYTPTGRCIQKPYSENYHEYYEEQMDRYSSGEMYKVDSTLLVDSLKYVTPKGKVVYGGGGIMPDIFVPFDTTGSSWYYTELRYASVFHTFAFDYVNGKRNKWKNISEFQRSFKVTDALLKDLTSFAKSEYGIAYNDSDFKRSKALIAHVLKSEIARQLWVEDGYYQIYNMTDNDVLEAIKELR